MNPYYPYGTNNNNTSSNNNNSNNNSSNNLGNGSLIVGFNNILCNNSNCSIPKQSQHTPQNNQTPSNSSTTPNEKPQTEKYYDNDEAMKAGIAASLLQYQLDKERQAGPPRQTSVSAKVANIPQSWTSRHETSNAASIAHATTSRAPPIISTISAANAAHFASRLQSKDGVSDDGKDEEKQVEIPSIPKPPSISNNNNARNNINNGNNGNDNGPPTTMMDILNGVHAQQQQQRRNIHNQSLPGSSPLHNRFNGVRVMANRNRNELNTADIGGDNESVDSGYSSFRRSNILQPTIQDQDEDDESAF